MVIFIIIELNRFDSYNKIKLKKYDVKTVLYRNSLYTVEISSKDVDLNSKKLFQKPKGSELYSLYKGRLFMVAGTVDLPTVTFFSVEQNRKLRSKSKKSLLISDQLGKRFFSKRWAQ